MCGIAGFHLPGDTSLRRKQLEACALSLAHRGPDHQGLYVKEDFYMAHTRLKVVDLSAAANQPFAYQNSEVVVSFNGEIYNYKSLKMTLQKLGFQFQTNSDTEVLAAAYLHWGNDFASKLDGMFAIAIYDHPKQKLLLVRDIFGQKPLYYSIKQGCIFGSEFGVFSAVWETLRPDLAAINHFLSIGYIQDPLTPYEDISLLQPASMLEYNLGTGQSNLSAYYSYADCFRQKHLLSLKDTVEQVTALLQKSVEKRWMGDVPMGIFLSAGLDSSGIAAICKDMGLSFPCYTIAFEGTAYNEADAAAQLCEAWNWPHRSVALGAVSEEQLNNYFDSRDYLTFDNSSFPIYKLAERAKQEVTFVLTGDGSDEVFGGYPTYRADDYNACIRKVIPLLKYLDRSRFFKASHDKVGWRTKAHRFFKGMHSSPIQAHYNWRLIFGTEERVAILGEEYRDLVYDTDPIFAFRKLYAEVSDLDWKDRHLLVDSRTWLSNNNLIKLDRNTMAHGLEARSPFLDKELTAFVASCPVNMKREKLLLKATLKRFLPQKVILRPKTGFNAPVGHWFSSDGDEFQQYTRKVFQRKFLPLLPS
jgi:asparagine synthase (glutamine-hydrolysing)